MFPDVPSLRVRINSSPRLATGRLRESDYVLSLVAVCDVQWRSVVRSSHLLIIGTPNGGSNRWMPSGGRNPGEGPGMSFVPGTAGRDDDSRWRGSTGRPVRASLRAREPSRDAGTLGKAGVPRGSDSPRAILTCVRVAPCASKGRTEEPTQTRVTALGDPTSPLRITLPRPLHLPSGGAPKRKRPRLASLHPSSPGPACAIAHLTAPVRADAALPWHVRTRPIMLSPPL